MDNETLWNTICIIVYVILLIFFATKCARASYTDLIQSIHSVPSERAENLSEAINSNAERYGVSSDLIVALIWQETHFRNVRGNTGEAGYLQVKPATFYQVCNYKTTIEDLIYDWRENIRCGTKYIAQLQAEYGMYDGISAYNAGFPIEGNSDYVREVLQKKARVD